MNIAMTAADVFKWVAWGHVKVKRIHGWNNQGAAIYIQLLEVPPVTVSSAPPTGTIPSVKPFLAQANNGFDYEFDGIDLSELTVGCSSTETSFTPVAAASGLDMTIEVDTLCGVYSSTVLISDAITGDLTTGVNSKQVWATASGPRRLLRVDWLSAKSPACYLQLFAVDSPVNGTVPLIQFPINQDVNGVIIQRAAMGSGGIVPLSGPSTSSAENTSKGCTLAVSTTSGSLTIIADSSAAIRAIYGDVTRGSL